MAESLKIIDNYKNEKEQSPIEKTLNFEEIYLFFQSFLDCLLEGYIILDQNLTPMIINYQFKKLFYMVSNELAMDIFLNLKNMNYSDL